MGPLEPIGASCVRWVAPSPRAVNQEEQASSNQTPDDRSECWDQRKVQRTEVSATEQFSQSYAHRGQRGSNGAKVKRL